MASRTIVEQARRLQFDDPLEEAAYRDGRRERDSLQTRRVALTISIMTALLGVMIMEGDRHSVAPHPIAWAILRFGILVPTMLAGSFCAGRPWGKLRLQPLMGACLGIAGAAYALEWAADWTVGMPLHLLWAIPTLTIWAAAMSLPIDARPALIGIVGVFGAGVAGVVAFVPNVDFRAAAALAVAYSICGWGLFLLLRWREIGWRTTFAYRRESETLAAELKGQYAALKQLTEQRDEFVGGVLHDLRSPLTRVLIGAEVLRGADERMREKMLDQIESSARTVNAFTHRFLEQHALQRAAAIPKPQGVSLGPIVERSVAQARLIASRKRQEIALEMTDGDMIVMADELLLDRALGNLLDNAVKYSPLDASIHVRVTSGGHDLARVWVVDTGPGFSADKRSRLFQPYVTLGQKTTGGEPSSGLGLSLVKHCVEGMGGTVGCESESGRGAAFWISLRRV